MWWLLRRFFGWLTRIWRQDGWQQLMYDGPPPAAGTSVTRCATGPVRTTPLRLQFTPYRQLAASWSNSGRQQDVTSWRRLRTAGLLCLSSPSSCQVPVQEGELGLDHLFVGVEEGRVVPAGDPEYVGVGSAGRSGERRSGEG